MKGNLLSTPIIFKVNFGHHLLLQEFVMSFKHGIIRDFLNDVFVSQLKECEGACLIGRADADVAAPVQYTILWVVDHFSVL